MGEREFRTRAFGRNQKRRWGRIDNAYLCPDVRRRIAPNLASAKVGKSYHSIKEAFCNMICLLQFKLLVALWCVGNSYQLTYSRTQRTLSIFFSTTGTSAQLILTGSCISIA